MNPYLVDRPALISFSGGRTSAFMLWHILEAYGGRLPADVHVAFANTGKEREETLRFVHECSIRWNVPVHWLEWRDRRKRTPVEARFAEVGYNSAARAGEPFAALIASKKALPNQQQRWCTEHLKVQAMHDFMLARGHPPGSYAEVIGLRADETWRYYKMLDRNAAEHRRCVAPLFPVGVLKSDVLSFWLDANADPLNLTHPLPQGFELGLRDGEGNCDYCFLKGRKLLSALIRQRKTPVGWWSLREQERGVGWSSRYRIAELARDVEHQPALPLEPGDDDEFDAECGLWCGEPVE